MTKLEELVKKYIEAKKKEADITKVTKDLNSKIKKAMLADDIDEVETDCGTARISVRKNESFDEENLINYLKETGKARGLVKKKEYIDYDALESAIYRESLTRLQYKNWMILR